jgi:methionine-rich copper-binding protein CopC
VNKALLIILLAISAQYSSNPAYAANQLGLLSSTPSNQKYTIGEFPMLSDLTFTSDIEKSSLEISLYKNTQNNEDKQNTKSIKHKNLEYSYLYELKKTVTNASYLANFITPELTEGKYLISWRVNQCTGDCLVQSYDSEKRKDAAKAFPENGVIIFEVFDNDINTNFKFTKSLLILFFPILILFLILIKKITPRLRGVISK